MYHNTYKYNPVDFATLQNMSEDLEAFYGKLEIYSDDKSDESWLALRSCWQTLFFTLKHREIAGRLSPDLANSIRDYLEELIENA